MNKIQRNFILAAIITIGISLILLYFNPMYLIIGMTAAMIFFLTTLYIHLGEGKND